jgi:phosphoglycerol transferase MdoB-like AlkP superfamily enzyme
MRERLRLLAYFSIFWISFQIIIRGIFMLYNHDYSAQLTPVEICLVFVNGLRMDVSFSGYFIMLTGLCLTISVFTQSRWLYLTLNVLSIFSLLISSIIVIVDLELYRHWGFRMDITPLFYLMSAESEALGSVDIVITIKLIFVLAALFTAALFIFSIWLAPQLKKLQPSSWKTALVLLAISGLMVIVIRGSLTVAPMNTGFVYFHKTKTFANHAAINTVWNFFKSLEGGGKVEYPVDFYDPQLSIQYFESLYPTDDSTTLVFTEEKPNIILFILESFTADIIEPLGGIKGLTPNLNTLCSEGILFDNFYSSGDRTDKGVVSILSGYPAQPKTSIIKYPAKAQKLPYLNHFIANLGYHTSFTYGGDVDFANFRSYLTNSRFDHITTNEDFPDEDESKWGVHDHIVFERAFQECDTARGPFFKVVLSLSSHEPFDVPMVPFIKGQDEESLFLNSCHYTDKSIGEFMTKAKASSWWKNTVIIFVADHGHRHPGNKELKAKERFRIPLLIAGGAITKDTVIHTYGGHTDIANTLLAQFGKSQKEFRYSKNILSPQVKSFAAYFFNNGYGFVSPEKYIVYDNAGKQFLNKEGATEEDLNLTRAYQQILYLDYNSK